ncbi:MAG: hypothetical protein RL477_1553 [Pseudomonadota bacterium]
MDILKRELGALAFYIQRVREEIAAIDRPVDSNHGFVTMGEQMDAIVKATEHATDTIMTATEDSEAALAELRAGLSAPEQMALLDRISNNSSAVIEACSFQDITGQRVNKVAKSLTYVESRVENLMKLMGADQIREIEVVGPQKTKDEALLNGPQLSGQGLVQSEIDKLFG